jgi:uncharacterized membrane protein
MQDLDHTDHPLERMVFFSDAVFAIAITLLVIEIEIPHLPHGATTADYLNGLIPSFVGYLLSFVFIARFWAIHHRAFALSRRHYPPAMGWNLALLGVVALLPWLTAFMSSNIRAMLPTAVYLGGLAVAGALMARVVHLATGPHMAGAAADVVERRAIRQRSLALAAGAATAALISPFLPEGRGLFGLLTIAVYMRVMSRWPARGAGSDAEERV